MKKQMAHTGVLLNESLQPTPAEYIAIKFPDVYSGPEQKYQGRPLPNAPGE